MAACFAHPKTNHWFIFRVWRVWREVHGMEKRREGVKGWISIIPFPKTSQEQRGGPTGACESHSGGSLGLMFQLQGRWGAHSGCSHS